MTGPAKSVAIRVGVEGEVEIKRKLRETGEDGQKSFGMISDAARKAGADIGAASRAAGVALDEETAATVRLGAAQDKQVQAYIGFLRRQQSEGERLRDILDPLGAAQRQYNVELAKVQSLSRTGAVSAQEQAAAEVLLRKRLDETTAAIKRRSGEGGGISSYAKTNLFYQGTDIATSLAGGMNPGVVAMQQGGQIMGIFAAEGPGALKSVMGLVTGVGALAAVTGIAVAAGMSHASQMRALELASRGYGATTGLTADQLDRLAHSNADAADVSVAAARKMAIAYATGGRVGEQTLGNLIALTGDYAAISGQKTPQAAEVLAKAILGGVDAYKGLNDQLHFLTAAEAEHVRLLMLSGQQEDAQRILVDRLGAAIRGAKADTDNWTNAFVDLWHGALNAFDAIGTGMNKMVQGSNGPKEKAADRALLNSREGKAQVIGWAMGPNAAAKYLKDNPASAPADPNLNSRSTQAMAAYRTLAPEAGRISEIRANQTMLRTAQSDKGLAAATGLNTAQIKEALAEGDRQIAQLEKKAAGTDRHAESLARNTAGLIANAKGAMTLADAYLLSADAGMRSESERKAMVDSATKGFDVQKRGAEQLALAVADTAAAGARAGRELADQTGYQKSLNDAVSAGVLTADQAAEQAQREAQLRPLLIAQLLSEGKAKEKLVKITDFYRLALVDQAREMQRAAILRQTEASNDNVVILTKELALIGATNRERAVGLAVLRAEIEAKKANLSPDSKEFKDRVASARTEAGKGADLSEGYALDAWQKEQSRSIERTQLESSLIGKTNEERDRALGLLEARNRLEDLGIDAQSDQGRAILDNQGKLLRYNAILAQQQQAYTLLQGLGEDVIDDLGQALTPDHWGDWSEAGKAALNDIASEFAKLALLNPIKNFLLGGDRPTLSSLGGLLGGGGGGGDFNLGSIFGGSSSLVDPRPQGFSLGSIFAYAGGTDYAPPGWAWVGEEGPELLQMRGGEKVRPAATSAAMARGGGGPQLALTYAPVIDARGADAAGMARLEAQMRQHREELPRVVIETMMDARERGLAA